MTTDEALMRAIELGTESTRLSARLYDQLERRIAGLEQHIADLDDATPSRRAFEELHSRVDELQLRADQMYAADRAEDRNRGMA